MLNQILKKCLKERMIKKRRRKNSRKKYGHRQPISLIRITKIFSKDGKLIAQAEPQKKLTKDIVKGEKAREKQILEAKNFELEQKKKIKKTVKKLKENKDKKKPLTTKKK